MRPAVRNALLTEALIIFTIAARPFKYHRLSFLPILAFTCYQIFFTSLETGGGKLLDAGLGGRLFASLGFASYCLLLKDAQNDIWAVGQKQGSISDKPLFVRLWWAAQLHYSPRAVGWSHEPHGKLPARPPQKTRAAFVVAQLAFLVRCILAYNVVMHVVRMNPYFDRNVDPADVLGYARLWRLGSALMWALAYTSVSIQYTALSIIWVGLGLSGPQHWPRYFASPLEMYTIRRFWGVGWHQMFRNMFSAHADFLAKSLHLPPKSKFTTYFKLFTTFAISGLLHLTMDYASINSWTQTWTMHLFILQAAGIMLEDGVLALARKAGLKETRFTRCLGYVWVVMWYAFSLLYWVQGNAPFELVDDPLGLVVDLRTVRRAMGSVSSM